jgi:hypothetical protein
MSARFTPVGALILSCSLAACGSSGSGSFDPAGRPDSATPSAAAGQPTAAPPSTMTTRQVNESVLARYREYWKIYKQIYETNNPTPLASIAIDPQLGIATKDVQESAAKGEVWRFTIVLNPKIQARSKDAGSVAVLDCVRTLGVYLYSAKTGKRLRAARGNTRQYQAILKFTGENWMISEVRQGKEC